MQRALRNWPAFVVLGLGLAITVVAWRFVAQQVGREAEVRFEHEVARAVEALDRHVQDNVSLLIGLRGLFDASERLERHEFKRYVSGFEISRRYPSVRLVSLVRYVPGTQKAAFERSVRNDVRIKMCTKVNDDDFRTLHHELGHNYYQRAYMNQPYLYQNGAHDGFHEAIGDALTLSITPDYLKKIGLLDVVPNNEKGLINLQMKDALEKIAFLPFGRMIDQWRWDVFSGKVKPEQWNDNWWALRLNQANTETVLAWIDEANKGGGTQTGGGTAGRKLAACLLHQMTQMTGFTT